MLEKADEIRVLLIKHMKEELSIAERARLDEWINQSEENRRLFVEFSDENALNDLVKEYYAFRNRKEFSLPAKVVKMSGSRRWFKWVAAAAVVLFVSLGVYFWQNSKQPTIAKTNEVQQPGEQEIMPANGSAILVLEDGRKVVLDSLGNGVIASNGGKEIVKENGQLSYQGNSKVVVYNTLVTSKGKVMSLQLADGSRVWLNAESSIRFPTEFPGKERVVEVMGEAYFEVAKNAAKPFIVKINTPSGNAGDVQVLGTEFNINAYNDESLVKTTLIEGSVRVRNNVNQMLMLKPGQQVELQTETQQLQPVENPDVDGSIAWRKGVFNFENADVRLVMKQLSRWYDIEIDYSGDIPDTRFGGKIERNIPLSEVLANLKKVGRINFKTEGRKVTVLP